MTKVMKVGEKGQVVIPKELRELLHINPHDEVIISLRKGRITITPKPKKYCEYMRGLGKEIWKNIDATRYVEKERETWEKKPNVANS